VRVEILNHASALLDLGEVRLLFDPWFEGTAFSGGWQLRYDNPGALDAAARATHLWISHWHSDHLHLPTLKKLAARAPKLHVLANASANFSMVEPLGKLGFRRVTPLGERVPLALGGGVTVTRAPTASIDNMLWIHTGAATVLNYNDCNLPRAALASLVRRYGPVDVLLCNYNHAGKLLHPAPAAAVRDRWWAGVERVVQTVAPRRVLPFASSHLYRSPASLEQNESLIDFDELAARAAADARFTVARIGESVELDAALGACVVPAAARVTRNALVPHDYGASAPWDEVERTAQGYVRRLAREHLHLFDWLPAVRVAVDDHARALELDLCRGVRERAVGDDWHLALHSRALLDWMGRKFGDDTLLAGAHFRVGRAPGPAKRLLLLSALASNHLAVRDLGGMLALEGGRRFLWSRREEIAATLLGARWRAGEPRL
jgi:L-ascorbate metabolism protein UlaG (beta-lactamase superfamily)